MQELQQDTLQEKNICLILWGTCAWKVHADISTDFGNICLCVCVYVLTKHDGQYFTQQCYTKLSLNMTAGWLYYMQTKKSLWILLKTFLWNNDSRSDVDGFNMFYWNCF